MANSNFSPFSRKKPDNPYNTVKTRDVYDSQNLERGEGSKAVSAKGRIWFTAIVSILTFIGTWALLNVVLMGMAQLTSGVVGQNYRGPTTFGSSWFHQGWWKFFLSFMMATLIGGLVGAKMHRNYKTQMVGSDHTDINHYEGDQHVALPMETMTKFEWFPDVGAHASPQVSSMISHVMLSNKGIDKVEAAQFYSKKDEEESGGKVLAGEHKLDDDDEIIFKKMPFFDKEFGEALFEASGITDKLKNYKKYYDATKISYMTNAENKRDSVGGGKFKTVAEVINADWELPYYEPQRPAGAYLVDIAPVNTMV